MADLTESESNGLPLSQMKTEGSIVLTPEMFERMYLSPENRIHGDLRRTFGNPTPLGLGGFLMAYGPIIFSLLGWNSTNYAEALPGTATVGTYYFSGGLLAIIAAIFEIVLGNSFPATFFAVFGGYFLSYGATITPEFNAYLAYSPSSTVGIEGLAAPAFLNLIGMWNILMGVFTVFCTICALRTNVLFVVAFFFLALTFFVNSGATMVLSGGMVKTAFAHHLQLVAGSLGFITLVIGCYLLLALMLTTVDFPINLPVGDLSTIVKSGSQLAKNKRDRKSADKQA